MINISDRDNIINLVYTITSMKNSFVTSIDLTLTEKFKSDLDSKGFTLSQPPHSIFSARKDGVSLTLYSSGKIVVQGKKKDDSSQQRRS